MELACIGMYIALRLDIMKLWDVSFTLKDFVRMGWLLR